MDNKKILTFFPPVSSPYLNTADRRPEGVIGCLALTADRGTCVAVAVSLQRRFFRINDRVPQGGAMPQKYGMKCTKHLKYSGSSTPGLFLS